LACQWGEVEVWAERQALILLTEAPEGADRATNLIIESVGNVTSRCIDLTAYRCLEAVSTLDGEVRIGCLDISICDLLRRKEQARLGGIHAALEIGFIQLYGKALYIAICAWESKSAGAARPGGRTCIGSEVIGHAGLRGTVDVDLDPPGFVGIDTNAKQRSGRILELPVANVVAGCVWRGHVHA
jgi:hypothetical protein